MFRPGFVPMHATYRLLIVFDRVLCEMWPIFENSGNKLFLRNRQLDYQFAERKTHLVRIQNGHVSHSHSAWVLKQNTAIGPLKLVAS